MGKAVNIPESVVETPASFPLMHYSSSHNPQMTSLVLLLQSTDYDAMTFRDRVELSSFLISLLETLDDVREAVASREKMNVSPTMKDFKGRYHLSCPMTAPKYLKRFFR